MKHRPTSLRRPLHLEPLESRRLLAPVNVPVNGLQEGKQYDPFVVMTSDELQVYSTSNQPADSRANLFLATSTNKGLSFQAAQVSHTANESRPAAAYNAILDQTSIVLVRPNISSGDFLAIRTDASNSSTSFHPVHEPGYRIGRPAIAADSFPGGGQVYLLADLHDSTSTKHLHDGLYFYSSPTASPQRISTSGDSGWLTVGTDHSIYAFWPDTAGSFRSVFMRRSTDGGQSFGPLITVGGDQASRVQVVTNPVSGHLYATYLDELSGANSEVMFTMSTDHGATWSNPVVVNDDQAGAGQFAPTIAVTPNGARLFVGFRDTRLDGPGADSFGAVGKINGSSVTFGKNFRISSETTDGGHSDSQAVADNHRFYFTWSDTRSDHDATIGLPKNVFLARIDRDGPAGPYVYSYTPDDVQIDVAVASATVTFSQPMDTTSFSFADDVQAFFGNGQDLTSTFTGFSWLNDRTLQINFTPIDASGVYTLRLSPDILNKWGNPQDNDFDGAGGEAGDAADIQIRVHQFPKYNAYAAPLVGAAKLKQNLTGVLETSATSGVIDLGARYFTMYGEKYSGPQVLLRNPGELVIGGQTITVLGNTLGASTVLYSFQDMTLDTVADLIVDWTTLDGSMSVQVILELGTGNRNGAMHFNYLDIDDPARPAQSGGRVATIGVHNEGAPVPHSYLSHWVGEGDIGIRSGMGLLLRDDRTGVQVIRVGDSAHVIGSTADDNLTIYFEDNFYRVATGRFERFVDAGITLSSLYVHGAQGNDRVFLVGNRDGDEIGMDGNDGDDSLTANSEFLQDPLSLFGGTGNDILAGSGSNDLLEGGPGNDTLHGLRGNDIYYFAPKTVAGELDVVAEKEAAGFDRLDFSMLNQHQRVTVDLASDPVLAATEPVNPQSRQGRRNLTTFAFDQARNFEHAIGGPADDLLLGNDRANVLNGDAGNDRLQGGPGNDVLLGGTGSDRLIGGRGHDKYRFLSGFVGLGREDDTVVEAVDQGTDTLDFSGLSVGEDITLNLGGPNDGTLGYHVRRHILGSGANLENVLGGPGSDTITGNALANQFTGGRGADTLNGGDGDDRLDGGEGFDTLIGAAGNDALLGGNGRDLLNGGGGNDELDGGLHDDRYLFGLALGVEVDNVFERFDGGIDHLDFSSLPASAPVTINLSQNNLATHAGRKVWTGIPDSFLNFENATGGDGDDTLIGNSGNNRLVGGPGQDTFDGGGGTDQMVQ